MMYGLPLSLAKLTMYGCCTDGMTVSTLVCLGTSCGEEEGYEEEEAAGRSEEIGPKEEAAGRSEEIGREGEAAGRSEGEAGVTAVLGLEKGVLGCEEVVVEEACSSRNASIVKYCGVGVSTVDELEREKQEVLRPLTSGAIDTGMEESGVYRRQIASESLNDPHVQGLCQQLKEWINDVLTDDHIVVKDLCEDLSDGQVLSALIERLADAKIEHREVAQSVASQKAKLTEVLKSINFHLQVGDDGIKWSVDNINNKYLVSVLFLLVSLARHYGIPRRLPSFVKVNVIQINKESQQSATIVEQVTGDEEREHYNFAARQQERDVFDTLFDSAPDKLNAVKGSLLLFANKQLRKLNIDCTNIEDQFSNGVNLVIMMSLAEGYYVPLYSFSMEPEAYDQKLHNVTLALNLMQEAGIPRPKCTAEAIVSKDLKSTLRVLYAIYTKYKHLAK